jgi:hypothetical protein
MKHTARLRQGNLIAETVLTLTDFPVLAKGLDIVTLRTPVTNDIMFSGEEGREERFVWVVV